MNDNQNSSKEPESTNVEDNQNKVANADDNQNGNGHHDEEFVNTQPMEPITSAEAKDISQQDDDNEENEEGVETISVRPANMMPTKKPRPGEITADMLEQHNSTKKLDDTDFEDGDPRWGTARFNKRMLLEIKLRDTGERFTFDYTDIDEIMIGRRDPQSGESPEIDLEPYGALNKGVSRRHAQIVRKDGALNLIDLGSPNGTFLNGQKLVSRQPRILRDGDDVRLGHLVVRVSFRRAGLH